MAKEIKGLNVCPSCKSNYTVRHGYNVTKKGKFARRKCQQCGTTFYEQVEQPQHSSAEKCQENKEVDK